MKSGFPGEATAILLLAAGLMAAQGQDLVPIRGSIERTLLDNPVVDWNGNFTNWVELSAGGFLVDDSHAAFEQRHQLPRGAFGGIESFHYELPTGKSGLVQVDGRGIFDNHDYALKLDYTEQNKGYVRLGYEEFRTWYDRHGGYSPRGNAWVTPFERESAIDRGTAWIEFGLLLPDRPELTFRYAHQFRDGSKDSTAWGDYNLNIGAAGPAVLRNIIPGFYEIDETRDIFEADLRHRIGDTAFGVGLRYEMSDQENKRNELRRVGELPPLVTPGSQRAITQREQMETDLFNVHAFTETWFNEKVLLTTGYSFLTLDADISGNRIYGASFDSLYDPTFGRRQPFDEGFLGLTGDSTLYQYVMNVNLLIQPWEHVHILPAVRVEKLDNDGSSTFLETTVGPAPARAASQELLMAESDHSFLEVSESLEIRSVGLRHWSWYARGEWSQTDDSLKENEFELPAGALALYRNTDGNRLGQKYSVGLNFYPMPGLSCAAQFYHKIHQYDYDHLTDSTPNTLASGDRYPAFIEDQDFETDDVNFRVNWRPCASVSLVTRYDFQLTRVDTTAPLLGEAQSAEITSHIISESVSWFPVARLNLQGSFHYALDQTETPANDLTGAPRNLVLTADNDYWNLNFLAALVLNDKTDLQGQFFYYLADNYRDNSAVSQPYGAGAREYAITVTLIRQLSDRVRWSLKYGFFNNNDDTFGGHRDFTAHLVHSSIQYRF